MRTLLIATALFATGCFNATYRYTDPATGAETVVQVTRNLSDVEIGELQAGLDEDGRATLKLKSYKSSVDAAIGVLDKTVDKIPNAAP